MTKNGRSFRGRSQEEIFAELKRDYRTDGTAKRRLLNGKFLPVTIQHGSDAPDGRCSMSIDGKRYAAKGLCRACQGWGR